MAERVGLHRSFFWVLGRTLYALAVSLVPISIATAVLRYRLWDIDVIITIAAALAVGVTLLQAFSRAIIGGRSALAVVASALIIATLAHPLRMFFQIASGRRGDDAVRAGIAMAAPGRVAPGCGG